MGSPKKQKAKSGRAKQSSYSDSLGRKATSLFLTASAPCSSQIYRPLESDRLTWSKDHFVCLQNSSVGQ